MKRAFCALLSLAAALLLTACGTDGKTGTDGITLTLIGKESDLGKSYMTSVFERYEAATGNHLNVVAYEDSEFERAAAHKFEIGDAPDLFMHFNNADLNNFDVAGNFYYLNGEHWVDDLTDGARAYCQDGAGNLLGLPFWENSVSGCYYNRTLLNELGLKPAATQKEFDMLCQALAETGYTPICWPGDGCAWMPQFAMDPIFADDPALLERLNNNEIRYADIPQMMDMLQWIADAADRGWFGKNYLSTGWNEISPMLSSGEAAMVFIWDTWFYTDFKPGKYAVEDFALMPVFMNTADGGTYEGGNLNMMMVNKNSEKLDAALEFLDFCASEENYNAAFDGISTVNCFKGQTTNIQSKMVTEATESIAKYERVSTAASKIIGYSGDDVVTALNSVFRDQTSLSGGVKLMDDYRIAEARRQGVPQFQEEQS